MPSSSPDEMLLLEVPPEALTLKVISAQRMNESLQSYNALINLARRGQLSSNARIAARPGLKITFIRGQLHTVTQAAAVCSQGNTCSEMISVILQQRIEETRSPLRVVQNEFLPVRSIEVLRGQPQIQIALDGLPFAFLADTRNITIGQLKAALNGTIEVSVR